MKSSVILLDEFNKNLAEHFNVKLSQRIKGAVYQPFNLSIKQLQKTRERDNIKFDFAYDVLHELSHFIVATKEQRQLKNFGLGSINGGEHNKIEGSVEKAFDALKEGKNGHSIEDDAIVLGAFIAGHFGYCVLECLSEFNYHDEFRNDELMSKESKKTLLRFKKLAGKIVLEVDGKRKHKQKCPDCAKRFKLF